MDIPTRQMKSFPMSSFTSGPRGDKIKPVPTRAREDKRGEKAGDSIPYSRGMSDKLSPHLGKTRWVQ